MTTQTLTLADFLLARIAEDEKRGDFDESTARQGRIVVQAASLGLYPGAQMHLRQFAGRYADHPDYRPRLAPLERAKRPPSARPPVGEPSPAATT